MGGDGGAQREGSERNLDACWMQMTFVGRINPLPCAHFNSLIHVPRFKASQRVLLHYVCSMPHSISLASLSLSPIHPPLPLSISLSLSLSLIHSLHSHFLTLMRCHCRIAPFLTAKYAEAVRRAHVFCVDEPTKIAAPSLNHENGRLHEHRALAARCCTHAAPTPSPRSSSISRKAAARSESGDLQAKDECPEDRHQT